MTQSGAGASAWIQLNSLGWAGEFLDKDSLGRVVDALNRTNPMFIDRPHLCFEQLYYYFFNVASSFKGLDNDVAYNAYIAMWLCNNCRASLTKPKPHPAREINEKEEYRKFFPDRAYELRHFLADRVQRAKHYIDNLPRGLARSESYLPSDVELFIRNIEDDYPEARLPLELALPIATLKQAVEIQKSKVLEVQSVGIVQLSDAEFKQQTMPAPSNRWCISHGATNGVPSMRAHGGKISLFNYNPSMAGGKIGSMRYGQHCMHTAMGPDGMHRLTPSSHTSSGQALAPSMITNHREPSRAHILSVLSNMLQSSSSSSSRGKGAKRAKR